MLAACAAPEHPLGARDRAMLLVGFGAALRRSELVGLAIGDIFPVSGRGLMLTVRRSKTDQQGRGQQVAVWPTRPSRVSVRRRRWTPGWAFGGAPPISAVDHPTANGRCSAASPRPGG